MHQEMKFPISVRYVKCGLLVDHNTIYYMQLQIIKNYKEFDGWGST